MIEFLRMYWYWFWLLASALGLGFLFWTFTRTAKREGEDARFGLSDYILLWPLLLTRRENGKTVRRGLTRRELVGWVVVFVIMILAAVFDRGRR